MDDNNISGMLLNEEEKQSEDEGAGGDEMAMMGW